MLAQDLLEVRKGDDEQQRGQQLHRASRFNRSSLNPSGAVAQ